MSFLFYDFETTGADPRRDRPLQFAAVRTDEELNEIEEPQVLYARVPDDCLTHPMAVLVTGLLPEDLIAAGGGNEYDLARQIAAEMTRPGTCAVGFNSMRFDAEMLRFLFWRNLIDPYAHEWRDGNSRWDVLDAARAFRVLRPDSIQWPVDEAGVPSLRLEALTAANGIEHGNAHDALADVRATIAMAKLMRDASPKLFAYLLGLRDKRTVERLVDERARSGFVHVSGRLPSSLGSASLFASFGAPAGLKNQRLLWDLRHDPAQLLDESVERLRARRFLSNEEISEEMDRLPMKILHLNRAPVVVAASILNEADVAERMQIDRTEALKHQAFVEAHYPELIARMQAIVEDDGREFVPQPVERALYGGFLPDSDRAAMTQFARRFDGDPQQALDNLAQQHWQDERLPDLVSRFIARNWPERLDDTRRRDWQTYLHGQLLPSGEASAGGLTYAEFFTEIERLQASGEPGSMQQQLLQSLYDWGVQQRQKLM